MSLRWIRVICAIIAGLVAAVSAAPVFAQVIWEDYQGNSSVGADAAGPNYVNNSGNSATNISNLRSISATLSNATRTGTSTQINYQNATPHTLCNATGVGGDANSAACVADAQGRVLYSLIVFPTTGTYALSLAHDDEVDIDLSSDFTNTSYRTASYDIPVGTLNSYTASDTTYENSVTLTTSGANRCALARIYWNNAGGINHLRLRWNINGGGAVIIPASAYLDPSQASSSSVCTGPITTTATIASIGVNKIVGTSGRIDPSDQFTVSLAANASGTLVTSATTSGSGTGQQASTGAQEVTILTVYRITDAMASGSSAIGSYSPAIACTRNAVAFTPTNTGTGTWTLSATLVGQTIVCNVTNTRPQQQLTLAKTWGANSTSGHTASATTTGGANPASFNATAPTASSGTAVTAYAGESITLPAETFGGGAVAAGYSSTVACTGGTTLAAAVPPQTIAVSTSATATTCTYTNVRLSAGLRTVKTLTSGSPALTGSTVTFQIVVTNDGPATATNVQLTDQVPAGLTFTGATLSQGTYSNGTGIWSVGSLANGASATLVLNATVN